MLRHLPRLPHPRCVALCPRGWASSIVSLFQAEPSYRQGHELRGHRPGKDCGQPNREECESSTPGGPEICRGGVRGGGREAAGVPFTGLIVFSGHLFCQLLLGVSARTCAPLLSLGSGRQEQRLTVAEIIGPQTSAIGIYPRCLFSYCVPLNNASFLKLI